MSLAGDIAFFEKSALTLLSGKKINPSCRALNEQQYRLFEFLTRLHAGHYISMEPQCYIGVPENVKQHPKYMGRTDIHPISLALYNSAEQLKSVCEQIGRNVAQFEVLGLDWGKRNSWRSHSDFQLDKGKVGVMVASDIASLWQAMSLIRQRLSGADKSTIPLIIQNDFYLWDYIFSPHDLNAADKRKKLQKYGIYFSYGAPDTATQLATFDMVGHVAPTDIRLNMTAYPLLKNPVFAFATTDIKKTNEKKAGLRESGATGTIRTVYDILGRYEITPEEQYSYEGNAAEKMEALIKYIRIQGTPFVRRQFHFHGYNDLSQVMLMVNDGGLGICLENEGGQRYINLFTQEFFPTSYHKMNKTQMAPAVELAYLMKAERGLETAFDSLSRSADKVCAVSSQFTKQDLRAYDTSLDMVVPLERVLQAIEEGKHLDIHSLGVVALFSAEKNKLSLTPKFAPGTENEVPKTNHFLIVPDSDYTRSQTAEWEVSAPHARTFNLMQAAVNATSLRDESKKFGRDVRANTPLGMIATPAALFARSAPEDFQRLKKILLKDFAVATKQGADYWTQYKDVSPVELARAGDGRVSNEKYRAGGRHLLDKASILYIGEQSFPAKHSAEQRLLQGLLFFSGIIRTQVFNPVKMFVNPAAVPALMDLMRHKQSMGLIGQATEDLITLVNGSEDAAQKIADFAKSERHKITQPQRIYRSDGQVEGDDCYTVTTYFSATNVNKHWFEQAERLGYLYAVNGLSLKVGGGNDGLMKAVADGFQRGKKELLEGGFHFPNQLILIQCVDTEEIEAKYTGGGIYRCHPTIEAREADLQNADMEVAGAGGAGTDEEIFATLYSRVKGYTAPDKKPLILYNQKITTKNGIKGVHDLYPKMLGREFMAAMNAHIVLTPEEIIARAVAHRAEKNGSKCKPYFIPPYEFYDGAEGLLTDIPQSGVAPSPKAA